MPDSTVPYVGLDVAKQQLDYALDDTRQGKVPNTPAGHAALLALLRPLGPVRVVCEASGGYHSMIVAALLAAGIEVCVAPPGRVRHFARATGQAAKTDPLDARLLRRFGQQCQPRLCTPPDPARAHLRELLDHRRVLLEQRVATENRQAFAGTTVARLLKKHLRFLDQQLAAVEQLLKQHLAAHPALLAHSERLQQLTGIGPISAWTLLAHLPELDEATDKELAALVGVAPYARDSGAHSGQRRISGGRAEVRRVLHLAARSAREHNPILRAFGDRLESRGKPYKVVIVAITRKLLIVARRLCTDPNFVLAT
jgi:transposase